MLLHFFLHTQMLGLNVSSLEFYDWRIDKFLYWVIFFCLPLSFFLYRSLSYSKRIKIICSCLGVLFLFLFCLCFIVIGLMTQFKQDPEIHFFDQISVESSFYRLYGETPLWDLFVPPSISVKREWDTPFGFKFVQQKWGKIDYCEVMSLRLSGKYLEVLCMDSVINKIPLN